MNLVQKVQSPLFSGIKNLIVPISRLNKGEANKIIEEVKESGTKIVCKNNTPEVALVSLARYDSLVNSIEENQRLKETIKDLQALIRAEKALIDPTTKYISEEEFEKENTFSMISTDGIEVEFE